MTLDERRAAFPHGCQVRRVNDHPTVGVVVGWSHKYDAIYVRKPGKAKPLAGPSDSWERYEAVEGPSIEEHW